MLLLTTTVVGMDQLDPSLVQRVNRKVSAVVERYLLDDKDVTPKNTRKAYGPKQAEWMVRVQPAGPFPLLPFSFPRKPGMLMLIMGGIHRDGANLASRRSRLVGRRNTR